ncbi:MAG: hypothetical protein ABIT38_14405 [Gemmatimonadaceae bacterium]
MTAIAIDSTLPTGATAAPRTLPRHFFTWMAVVCMLVAFIGFAPSYWLPVSQGRLRAAPIFHIHGLLFSFWTVFFVAQSALVSTGRIKQHRAVGLLGISLATAMVIIGFIAAIASLRHSLELGFGEGAVSFAIVPIAGILTFAVLLIAAIANVRRADVHKRLMLVATASLVQAAVGRIFLLFLAPPEVLKLSIFDRPPPPVMVTVAPGFIVDLIIVVAMVFDWRTRGRPHFAYVAGLAFVIASQILRVPLSATETWHTFARGMLGWAG